MKKLLLVLVTLMSFGAFAQNKDLEVTLLSPPEASTIRRGTPFTLAVQFKNIGMDSVKVEDTLRVSFLINGNPLTIGGASVFLLSHPTIFHDSSVFFVQNGLQLAPNATDSNAEFCVLADLSFNGERQDTALGNNVSCNEVILSDAWPTALNEVSALAASVKAFPNPASASFTITMKSTDATVSVTDITGKLIETTAVVMGEAKMDVSNYANGVYFYQIKDASDNMVKSGKFTVSH
jgi:hypothetical protein